MRFAITLTSEVWRGSATAKGLPAAAVRFEPASKGQPDLTGRVGVRLTASGKVEINLGPLEMAQWRDLLAATRTIRAEAAGVPEAFPAGDLWVWLPAFEQCASALERKPAK